MNVKGPDGKVIFFPDGTPQDQIKAAMRKHYGGPSAASAPAGVPWNSIPLNPLLTGLSAGAAINQLPNIGGLVGGLGGAALGIPSGPGAYLAGVGGAGVGGAVGEAAKRALFGQPLEAGPIAASGGAQAFYDLFGRGLAAGASKLVNPLMKGALRPSASFMERFPGSIQTAISEKLPATAAGLGRATALRRESSDALLELLNNASSSGKEFGAADVTAQARALARNPALTDSDQAAIASLLRDFEKRYIPEIRPPKISTVLDQYGKPVEIPQMQPQETKIDPVLLKKIKQRYQSIAAPAYKAAARDESPGAAARRDFAAALASGAKQQLETIPGVAAQEARTQALIGARKAIKKAVLSPPPRFELMRPGTYPIVGALQPALESRASLLLADPGFRMLLQQSPRAAAALISQLMYTSQPDATAQP